MIHHVLVLLLTTVFVSAMGDDSRWDPKHFEENLFALFLAEVPPDAQGKVHHNEPSLFIEAVKGYEHHRI